MRAIIYSLYDTLFYKNHSKSILLGMESYFKKGHENLSKRHSLLSYSVSKVPFYKVNTDLVFEKFKVLTKSILKNNLDDFLSPDYSISELIKGRTSGSTASPMIFYLSREKKRQRIAELIFFNRWAGYEIGMKHALNSIGASKSKFKLLIQNEVLLDPSKLNKTTLKSFCDSIINGKVEFYIGYPSVLNQLATYIKKQKLDIKLKGIISTGEPLTETVRENVELAFRCKVYSRYSSLELGVIAHECEFRTLHVNGSNLFVEVLKFESDDPVNDGEIGRVVVTDFNNYAMPLIRYDTGDLASIENSNCKCGRKGKVIKNLEGRKVDFIVDSEGNKLSFAFLNTLIWPYHDKIVHYQFLQEVFGVIELSIEINTSNVKFVENLESDIKSNLSINTEFNIKVVDEIKPMKSGKKPFVINNYLKNIS